MTEDQIEPLCQRLYEALEKNDRRNAIALSCELLAGCLVDINRLAWFTQQLVEKLEEE